MFEVILVDSDALAVILWNTWDPVLELVRLNQLLVLN